MSYHEYNRYDGNMSRRETVTIAITPRLKDYIQSMGRKGETYDDILERLLDAPWIIHDGR